MEVLEEKIQEAERFRDCYYRNHPQSSLEEKSRAVREKVLPLIQDIPLDVNGHSSTAEYSYICGRILNICIDFDANCERYLTHAVKLDPSLSDAWLELGECVWKKRDFKTAVDCFRTSLSRKRTAKCVSALGVALRQCALNTDDPKTRNELYEESALLCAEAVKLDPQDENAWHTLGNSYLSQFFLKQQSDSELMDKARSAYEKALQLGDRYCSADLHLNYSTALKFSQNYGECLKHMKIATVYEPGFFDVKERLETLMSFLRQINRDVQKKGKLSSKKIHQFLKSLCDNDLGIYGQKKQDDEKSSMLDRTSFGQLKEGINKSVVICGKVIQIVPNPESVPYTFIGCDSEGSCCAFTIYNCSNTFGVVVGDSITVPEPHVIDVKVSFEDDKIENLDFRIIRIMNPLKLLKNGKTVSRGCLAFCTFSTTFVS